MKYLKLFENFEPMSREEMFGKQTNLEKQFSKIITTGLIGDNNKEFWSTFNALKIEIKDVIGKEDSLYQELMYRITDDQDPVKVMYDICQEVTNPEIERLLKKLTMLDPNPLYKEEEYSDDEEMERFDEAIIKPYDFDQVLAEVKRRTDFTIENLNELFSDLNVKFVDVDYFKSKLQTKKEIELVPINMPEIQGGIRFGAHNIHTNMMYICVNDKRFLKFINAQTEYPNLDKGNLLDLLREILRHESIHKQQGEKRSVVLRNLENSPMKPKEYFGSTDEIMAYAQSFIDQCHQKEMSNDDIIDVIRGKKRVSWVQNVYSQMDTKIKNRFNKYVYQYLTNED
jgi:hypothetical protein